MEEESNNIFSQIKSQLISSNSSELYKRSELILNTIKESVNINLSTQIIYFL